MTTETSRPAESTRKDTLARELALKLLYVMDLGSKKGFEDQVEVLLQGETDQADVRRHARQIFASAREHLPEVDARIQEVAINWLLSRMPAVDRAILRLGTTELLYSQEVPPKVTISEAIELAKKYSTEKSGAFVNGLLDKLYQTLCPQKV
ncbi:MAG: transcription antitermination factor NusB [Planctomycetes bacterium]|nr:transcription antitermination factor NusB [Planctomycetota bacterium]